MTEDVCFFVLLDVHTDWSDAEEFCRVLSSGTTSARLAVLDTEEKIAFVRKNSDIIFSNVE